MICQKGNGEQVCLLLNAGGHISACDSEMIDTVLVEKCMPQFVGAQDLPGKFRISAVDGNDGRITVNFDCLGCEAFWTVVPVQDSDSQMLCDFVGIICMSVLFDVSGKGNNIFGIHMAISACRYFYIYNLQV